jgi:hypothetical protein
MWSAKSKLQQVVLAMFEQPESEGRRKQLYLLALALSLMLFAGPASAQQYPLLDEAANRVVQKYQNASSCGSREGSRDRSGKRKLYGFCATIHRCAPCSSTE